MQEPTDLPSPPPPKEQTRHARLVLVQIQWLVIILLIGAIAWLRQNQIALIDQVENRLAITETFTQRLNNIDDKIFALTPIDARTNASEQEAKNDLKLIQAQLTAATRLYESGDYLGASEILASLKFQLGAGKLIIAAPLTGLLNQSLTKDIEMLNLQKSQPDAWQVHIINIKRIQSYLRTLPDMDKNSVTRTDMLIHDSDMLFALASNAAAMHNKDMMTSYLQDALVKMEQLKKFTLNADNKGNVDKTEKMETKSATISTFNDAMQAVNELLANPPKSVPLATTQVLKASTIKP